MRNYIRVCVYIYIDTIGHILKGRQLFESIKMRSTFMDHLLVAINVAVIRVSNRRVIC